MGNNEDIRRGPPGPRALLRRGDLTSLAAILACVLVASAGLGLIGPLVNLMMNEAGLPRAMIGLNAGMIAAAILIMTPVIPALVHRFGKGPFLIACLALCVLTCIAFPMTEPGFFWFPLRFLFGCGACGLFVVSEAWINGLATDGRRGLLISLYATVHSIGFALGALIIVLVEADGLARFLVGAVIMGLAGVPIFLARGLVPEVHAAPSSGTASFIRAEPFIFFSALLFGAIEIGAFALIPVYGVRLGLEMENGAYLLVAITLGTILCQVPIGLLADRLEKTLVMSVCALIGLFAALALPFSFSNLPALSLVLFVLGGAIMGLYTVGLTLLGERFKGAQLTSANSAFIFMYGAGSLIGPALSGLAMDAWDPHGLIAFLAVSCTLFVAMIAFRTIPRRARA